MSTEIRHKTGSTELRKKNYDQRFTFDQNVPFHSKRLVHLDGQYRPYHQIQFCQSQRLNEGLKSVSPLRTVNQINN